MGSNPTGTANKSADQRHYLVFSNGLFAHNLTALQLCGSVNSGSWAVDCSEKWRDSNDACSRALRVESLGSALERDTRCPEVTGDLRSWNFGFN